MPARRPPRAVLFDFDGVLADTENIHVAAWERTFAALGWEVASDVCARAAEEDDRAFLSQVFAEHGVHDGDVAGWVARKQQLMRTLLADSPRLHHGVKELVRALRERQRRLAVVSGTWRENVAIVLGTSGIADHFELIVGKEDVAHVKPHPEVYHRALEKLRVSASHAVAIEDSPSGLQSAHDAHVRCLAIGHRRPRGPWLGDAPFLPNFHDTDAALRLLLENG